MDKNKLAQNSAQFQADSDVSRKITSMLFPAVGEDSPKVMYNTPNLLNMPSQQTALEAIEEDIRAKEKLRLKLLEDWLVLGKEYKFAVYGAWGQKDEWVGVLKAIQIDGNLLLETAGKKIRPVPYYHLKVFYGRD